MYSSITIPITFCTPQHSIYPRWYSISIFNLIESVEKLKYEKEKHWNWYVRKLTPKCPINVTIQNNKFNANNIAYIVKQGRISTFWRTVNAMSQHIYSMEWKVKLIRVRCSCDSSTCQNIEIYIRCHLEKWTSPEIEHQFGEISSWWLLQNGNFIENNIIYINGRLRSTERTFIFEWDVL